MANEYLDKLTIGDILVGCYSYNTTFYDFYEVVGKTASSVKLQKLGKSYDPNGTQMSTRVKPRFKTKVGEPFTRRVTKSYVMEDGKWSTCIRLEGKYNKDTTYSENYMD